MVAPQDSNAIGKAIGRIDVDISALIAARDNAVRAGREISNALKGIGPSTDQGVRQAESGLQRLNRQLDTIASKGSLAFGTFIAGGVKSANTVGQLETKFRILVGSQKQANIEAEKLRGYAEDTNQPYLKVLESASMLQTAIKGTRVDLQEITSIASRLSIKSPEQGPLGAGIALQEYVSGDYMSLVRRFELDRATLQKIRQEANGDVQKMVEGLDEYLTKLGLTNDALKEMGEFEAFGLLKDDLQQTMAVGFDPFLRDFLIPASKGVRELIQEMREFNPELLKVATTLAAIAGTGAALKGGIPLLGIPGIKGAKQLGVGGASIYGGVQLGTAIARQIPGSEVEGKSQSEAMQIIGERFKQTIGIIISGMSQFAKILAIGKAGLELLVAGIDGILTKISGAINLWAGQLMNAIDDIPGIKVARTSESTLDEFRAKRDAPIISQDKLNEIGQNLAKAGEDIDDVTLGLLDSLGLIKHVENEASKFMNQTLDWVNNLNVSAPPPDFSQEQIEAFAEFQDTLKEIETQAQEEREDALDKHEKAKTDIQAEYDRRLERMQDDEELRRTRAVQSRDRAISEALGRSADKESDIYAAHRDKLADLEGDFRASQIKGIQDHERRLQRMRRDNDLARMKAAARLDFQSIFEMDQRNKLRESDEREDFETRQRQRQTEYDEALAQEQAALSERLQANQDAEDARIDQIKQSFVESEALQAENRAIQLQRMQEDHQLQLAKMDEQHAERLAQIDEQAKERADLENQAFVDLFNQLAIDAGQHEDRLLGIHRRGQQQIERELTQWWNRQNRLLNLGSRGVAAGPSGNGRMGGYQNFQPDAIASTARVSANDLNHNPANRSRFIGLTLGGRSTGGEIRQTGAYQLEAGEGVLRRDVWAQAKRMMGGEMTQHGALAAMGGGRGGVTFGDFNMSNSFGDIGGYSKEEILNLIQRGTRSELVRVLQGYVGA